MQFLFSDKPDWITYLQHFKAGMVSTSLQRGLDLKTYEELNIQVAEFFYQGEHHKTCEPLLTKLSSLLGKEAGEELFTRVGAIFTIAAQNGVFTLP
ncbi:MAG: hypothetical protein JNJ83_23345 [Verrucomicrobiaceae bacterium]|nr:hypothetical protein [Verrucomicrobiaceae bacterium]